VLIVFLLVKKKENATIEARFCRVAFTSSLVFGNQFRSIASNNRRIFKY